MNSILSLLVMTVLLSYSSAMNPVALRSSSSVLHSDENNYLQKQQQQQHQHLQLRRSMEEVSDYNEGNSSTTYNDDNGGYDSEESHSLSTSIDINWNNIKVSPSVIGAFFGGTICLILLCTLMLIFHCGNREMSDKYENLINKKKKDKDRMKFFGSRSTSSKPRSVENIAKISACKSWSTTNSDSNDDSTCSDNGSVHSFLSAKISITEDEVSAKSQSIDSLRKAMGVAMMELA
jgi:hypothetical protein